MAKPRQVMVPPSAAGPSMRLENNADGTVHVKAGKSHEAQEGTVLNPGVKTISSAASGPACPFCGNSTLKMHMNKPVGERVYCSSPGCNYDQAALKHGGVASGNSSTKVMDRASGGKGVKILRGGRSQ